MKRICIVLALVVVGITSFAQNSEIELFQSIFKVEKKALLMDYLQLTNEEAQAFWPIYAAYEAERGELGNQRIALIKKYAEAWQTLTPEQADALANESFAIINKRTKLHQKYYKKIKKAAGALRAAQFVQFERFVQTMIDAELNNNMPLIGEGL